jgi:SAM-dependent methyltransferase
MAPDLTPLFDAGDATWRLFRERCGNAFHAFVPGDYPAAARALARLRPHADSFLELGSGVGVVAISAALLGYDAAGVEIDPWLVDRSNELAAEFGAEVAFGAGTFVPAGFQEVVDRQQTEIPTLLDGPCGYLDLGRDLDEFDLVYAFFWPGLEEMFFELMRRYGRPGALLLTYGGLEGYRVWRDGVALDLL